MENKVIKQLNGHSGCVVTLEKQRNQVFVSKSAADAMYNYRLKKQLKKQQHFVRAYNVYTPEIFDCGYKNNLFFFNMEYIQGKTLAEYTNDISISEIPNLITCLFNCLYFENSKIEPRANELFGKKIYDLHQQLCSFKYLQPAFSILESFDWSLVDKSFCHGDLTLENILITHDKKLYLIDFLDSFYNSWMIDIAKLLQDLDLKWAFRNTEVTSNRDLRLQVAKDTLIEEILKIDNGTQKLETIYHILLLNIIRIYPYTKDKMTFDFLNWSVSNLLEKINKNKVGVVV